MKKEIILEIKSNEKPYKYEGKSILNKDLLIFNDNEYQNIFDFKTERLIREKKNYRLIIDFLNNTICLTTDEIDINFEFEVLKKKIDVIDVDITYKIKFDEKRLIIKEVK